MQRQNKIVSPSVPVNCRAFLECDELEFTILAAVQACHWVKDGGVEIGAVGLSVILPKVPLRNIERGLASLKKRGLIEATKGFGKPSKFAIYLEDLPFQALRELLHSRQIGGNESATLAGMTRQIGGNTINRDSKEDSKPETNGFAQWWAVYPNKASRARAAKAWAKLKPSATLQAALLRDTEMRRSSIKWTKDGGQYCPHGATYLNNEGWNDPIPPECAPAAALELPGCSHPESSFQLQEAYPNGSRYGHCGACNIMVMLQSPATA